MTDEYADARRLLSDVMSDDHTDLVAGSIASNKVAVMAATTYKRLLIEGVPARVAEAVCMAICLEPYKNSKS